MSGNCSNDDNGAPLNPHASEFLPLSQTMTFDNDLVLQNLIRAQIEYFFSDYHLTNDTYLLARMAEDPEHWVSLDIIAKMPRIRHLTSDRKRIQLALSKTIFLELNKDRSKVRRPNYKIPKQRPNRDLRRTVFVYGIHSRMTQPKLKLLLDQFGGIKRIHWSDSNDEEAPIREVAQLIMRKKFHPKHTHNNDDLSNNTFVHPEQNQNDPTDFSHLKYAFVVFESQSQATKCVKSRVRSPDGIRCMHKYDYNKVAKKYMTAKLKGETDALFSPSQSLTTPTQSSQNRQIHSPQGLSPLYSLEYQDYSSPPYLPPTRFDELDFPFDNLFCHSAPSGPIPAPVTDLPRSSWRLDSYRDRDRRYYKHLHSDDMRHPYEQRVLHPEGTRNFLVPHESWMMSQRNDRPRRVGLDGTKLRQPISQSATALSVLSDSRH